MHFRRHQQRAQRRDARRLPVVGLAYHQHVAPGAVVDDFARRHQVVGRIDHRADGALGRHAAREQAARVQPRQVGRPRAVFGETLPVPPRNSVLHEYERVSASLSDGTASASAASAVALVVTKTTSCAPRSAAGRSRAPAPRWCGVRCVLPQRNTVCLDRRQVGAARHHRNVVAGGGEFRRQVTPDRPAPKTQMRDSFRFASIFTFGVLSRRWIPL
jgi:hypothetical protein